jgi:hypothetical protein
VDPEPDEPIDYALILTPGELERGEMSIASLRSETGQDLSTATSARFFGGVDIHAMEARADEILFSMSVQPEAELGPIDLLVEFEDGRAVYSEGTLVVLEATVEPDPSPCDP